MVIFIATLLTFVIAFFAFSVGMIFSDIKIKGHCGSPSLDDGCCDSDSCNPPAGSGIEQNDGCSLDVFGNKINRCDTCGCED